MKLRMKNNSVRLRLTTSEMARFVETGQVKETIEFGLEPSQKFVYSIECDTEIEEIQANIENNRMTVLIPKMQADEWTSTTQTGLESEQIIGGGKTLLLLIEKDFACSEPRKQEDDRNAIPNPSDERAC